jgi:hypothetical protein
MEFEVSREFNHPNPMATRNAFLRSRILKSDKAEANHGTSPILRILNLGHRNRTEGK